jgi:alkylhydroperoxidase family enzyme
MAHIAGDPRALHPGVVQTFEFIRDNVLRSGVVDQEIKELCLRYVAQDEEVMDLDRFEGRERAALEWANAIVWDADLADDDLWRRLHEHFTDPELVDLGCAVGFELGQRHFMRTLGAE